MRPTTPQMILFFLLCEGFYSSIVGAVFKIYICKIVGEKRREDDKGGKSNLRKIEPAKQKLRYVGVVWQKYLF